MAGPVTLLADLARAKAAFQQRTILAILETDMTETVKVQRPIHTTDPDAPWLIYDAAKKHVEERPDRMIPAYIRDQMRGDFKAYFTGAWSGVVGWGISNRVSDDQEF